MARFYIEVEREGMRSRVQREFANRFEAGYKRHKMREHYEDLDLPVKLHIVKEEVVSTIEV